MTDLDRDGNLAMDAGDKLPRLALTPMMVLDKTISIYGPSGTGKTIIVKHIMKCLAPHVEQILIVAPTEPTNRSYEGYVDPTLIHYRLYLAPPAPAAGAKPVKDTDAKAAMRFLEAIWQRQEMMASTYKRANNAKVLAVLFGRLPKAVRARGLGHINAINSKREEIILQAKKQYAAEPGRSDEKVKEINQKFRQMLVLIYKQAIIPSYEELWLRDDLSEEEKYCLYYIKFNPRLLLIFDDCAAQLKAFFNKDIFRKLYYQNRHSYITVVTCCQDDTDLPTNLRKNSFLSVFTEQIVCISNFERKSNQFPKTTKTFVNEAAALVFRGHRKLAYIREDSRRKHFYHFECSYPQPFQFGSAALAELCEEVKNKEVAMDVANPYYDRFRIES